MNQVPRRTLIYFAWCIALSVGLTIVDLAGFHSVTLRVVAIFSLISGIVVLTVRSRQR